MTTLYDLKNLIATHNYAQTNLGNWSVSGSFVTAGPLIEWETLEQLVKIAEAAFELRRSEDDTELVDCDCDNCVNDPILERIQALKKELESD